MRTDMSQVPVNRTRGKCRLIAAATVTTALLAPGSVQSQATTCTVTSSDSGPGTLRERLANSACSVIKFNLGAAERGTDIKVSSPLIIDRDVTINGPSLPPDVYLYPDRGVLLVDGSRVFEVLDNASQALARLGFTRTGAPVGGGAILKRRALTASHSEFVANTAFPTILSPSFAGGTGRDGTTYSTTPLGTRLIAD
jgi:hypothetical protein